MSGLAALVAGRVPAGVYRWESGLDAAQVAHAVGLSDWTAAYVDGWTAQTKTEVLTSIGSALGFPETYGRNVDALWDCLRDLDRPVVLLWDGWSTLAEEDPRTFDVLLRLLSRRAAEAADSRTPFAVLLRGRGPEVDVPVLQ